MLIFQNLHNFLPFLLPNAQHTGVPAREEILLHLYLLARGRGGQEGRVLRQLQHEGVYMLYSEATDKLPLLVANINSGISGSLSLMLHFKMRVRN